MTNPGSSPSAGSSLILPGTFKSMLHPSITGDISIYMPGVSNISSLLNTAPLSDASSQSSIIKSNEFPARVQLTYRSLNTAPPPSNNNAMSPNGGANSSNIEPKLSPNSVNPGRRVSIVCRGKISISAGSSLPPDPSTQHGDSTPSSSSKNGGADVSSGIRQYDMMFVQADFEPGQPFFAVTFSKTLVNNGAAGPHKLDDDVLAHDRGLMLSGHFSNLRGYDVGTVRVHLPSGSIAGDALSMLMDSCNKQLPQSDNSHSANASPAVNTRSGPPSFSDVTAAHHDGPPGFSVNSQSPYVATRGRPASQSYPTPPSHFAESYNGNSNTATNSPSPVMTGKSVRYCYGCGDSGHLHKDCPRDQLFCYNCNQTGHSSKNCKKPKPWEQGQQPLQGGEQQGMAQPKTGHSPMTPHRKSAGASSMPSPPGSASGYASATWSVKSLQDNLPSFSPMPSPQNSFYQPVDAGNHFVSSRSSMSPPIRHHNMVPGGGNQGEVYGAIGSPIAGDQISPDIRHNRSRGYTTSFVSNSPAHSYNNMHNTMKPKRPSFSYANRGDDTAHSFAYTGRLANIDESESLHAGMNGYAQFPHDGQYGGNNNNNNGGWNPRHDN